MNYIIGDTVNPEEDMIAAGKDLDEEFRITNSAYNNNKTLIRFVKYNKFASLVLTIAVYGELAIRLVIGEGSVVEYDNSRKCALNTSIEYGRFEIFKWILGEVNGCHDLYMQAAMTISRVRSAWSIKFFEHLLLVFPKLNEYINSRTVVDLDTYKFAWNIIRRDNYVLFAHLYKKYPGIHKRSLFRDAIDVSMSLHILAYFIKQCVDIGDYSVDLSDYMMLAPYLYGLGDVYYQASIEYFSHPNYRHRILNHIIRNTDSNILSCHLVNLHDEWKQYYLMKFIRLFIERNPDIQL